MTEALDAITALAVYVNEGDDILALVGPGGVFGLELPDAMSTRMPTPAVVISDASGLGFANLPLDRPRVDVRSYAETPQRAKALAAAVHARLKALRRQVVGPVFLHSATPSGGFLSLREPVVRWPLTLRSYVVLHDEREVI